MALCCPNFQWRFWVRWLVSFANQSYLKGCSQWTGVIIHAAVGADSHSNSKPENSKEDCPNDFNWKSQSETYFSISTFSRKNSNLRVGFILHLFPFPFIFYFIYVAGMSYEKLFDRCRIFEILRNIYFDFFHHTKLRQLRGQRQLLGNKQMLHNIRDF